MKSQSMSCTSMMVCGAACTASTYSQAPTSCAMRAALFTSLMVPSRLLAAPRHTSRVRFVSRFSSSRRSNSKVSVSKGSHSTSSPKSRAIASQGYTFPSWSMRDRIT